MRSLWRKVYVFNEIFFFSFQNEYPVASLITLKLYKVFNKAVYSILNNTTGWLLSI